MFITQYSRICDKYRQKAKSVCNISFFNTDDVGDVSITMIRADCVHTIFNSVCFDENCCLKGLEIE